MDEQIGTLSRRVERLERSNRINRILCSLAVGTVVVVGQLPSIWADKNGPKSFSAQQFLLVDNSGRTTAALAPAPAGGAALTFYDPNGARTVSFGFADDAKLAGTILYDGNTIEAGNGIRRGSFDVTARGSELGGQVTAGGFGWDVEGPDGNRLAQGGARFDGVVRGTFTFDSDGSQRTFTGVASPTLAGSFVSDANGNIRGGIDVDTSFGNSAFFTLDANGTVRSFIGSALDGSLSFEGQNDAAGLTEAFNFANADGSSSGDLVSDAKGTLRVQSFQSGAPAGVNVFNSSGSTVAHLP